MAGDVVNISSFGPSVHTSLLRPYFQRLIVGKTCTNAMPRLLAYVGHRLNQMHEMTPYKAHKCPGPGHPGPGQYAELEGNVEQS